MSTFALGYIVVLLVVLLLIYSVYHAFTHKRPEATVSDHLRTLRRSIGATFIFGLGLTIYSQPSTRTGDDWQYGGPLLAFTSAMLYGYARKAEKAALTEHNKK